MNQTYFHIFGQLLQFFFKSNRSNRDIIEDGNHNIAIDILLKNVFISISFSFSSYFQTFILPKS